MSKYIASAFILYGNCIGTQWYEFLQIFPQRKSFINQHIQIDTVSMIDLLIQTGQTQCMKKSSSPESRALWFQYFDLANEAKLTSKAELEDV